MAIDKEQIVAQVVKFLVGFFSKEDKVPMIGIEIPLEKDAPPSPPAIDWISPASKITEHFTVSDACMLHNWNRLANEMDGFTPQMQVNMITLCQKMEEIRALLGCPLNVHCMFRSTQYNIEQKILLPTGKDAHSMGLAVDFDASPHMTIDQIHAKLEPELEKLGIRMERNTPTWCHVDLHPVINARYFNA